MMNIDEAIAHAKEVAQEKYNESFLCHENPNDDKLDGCIECAKEHEQLAEWLTELKKYKQLEQQGLLPKCRPGDAVYEIHPSTGKITERKIRKITICNAPNLTIMYESGFHYLIVNEDFGKTVFLTQAEADAALKKRKVGNKNGKFKDLHRR